MSRSFKIRATTVHERFGEESVIVNLDSGSYYSVQGTGDSIWALLASGASETEIIAAMTSRYRDDDAEISSVTVRFLDQLVEESLVDVDGRANVGNGSVPMSPSLKDIVFAAPWLQKYTDMEELLRLDPIHEVDEAGWPSRKAPE